MPATTYAAHTAQIIECDIDPGMTLPAYRWARNAHRAHKNLFARFVDALR